MSIADTRPHLPGLSGMSLREAASLCLAIAGAVLLAGALSMDFFGGRAGLGRAEIAGLLAGGGLVLGAALLRYGIGADRGELVRFLTVCIQIALLAALFRVYEIENEAFHSFILVLVATGFVVNHFLPPAFRPAFFLLLSLAGFAGVLGPVNAAVLIMLGLGMIGVCHLRVSIWLRIGILVLVAVILGAMRAGMIPAGSFMAILPILASIFMFRLVIYLYDLSTGKGPTGWAARLSYFFMLPNVVFPFFPVVDFTSWGKDYYRGETLAIYQRGCAWLFFGAMHLLLYRFVNYYLMIEPAEVSGFWQFLYYAAVNFSLYLKISGLFHTILGCLYLFGFALPETHTRFYLTHSFTEFWRRTNIYWKDFMQKMVFNPVYAMTRKRGIAHERGVIAAILAVFFLTWALHVYQWFWLLGATHLTWTDAAFWGLLGLFLVIQTTHEARPPNPQARALVGPRTLLALRTVCSMLTIIILWSMWSSDTFREWFDLLAAAGFTLLGTDAQWTAGAVLQSLAFAAFMAICLAVTLGFTFGLAPPGSHPRPSLLGRKSPPYPFLRIGGGIAVVSALALLIQMPSVYLPLPRDAQLVVVDMGTARLSARDQAQLERGYYENLTNVRMINSELWDMHLTNKPDWPRLEDTIAVDYVGGYRDFVLRPHTTLMYKGQLMSTNALGMRDREYTVDKPAGTLRIGMYGASRLMGAGLRDDETFENLIEDALNADGRQVEVLNFGVAGYDAFQKQMVLDDTIDSFAPDIVVHVGHNNDYDMGRRLSRYLDREMPYGYMTEAIARAGVAPDMEREEIERRLKPEAETLLGASYRGFVETVRARGAVPVYVFLPSTVEYTGLRDDTAAAIRLAREAGFHVIDLDRIYEDVPVDRLWIAPWDYHPNAMANRMIAERILSDLRAIPELADMLPQE